jgi:hypothetical protein
VGEEHEVSGGEAAQPDVRAGAPLGPAHPGQPYSGAAVGGHGQARAVVRAWPGRPPQVRLAQLGPGERDRPGGGPDGAPAPPHPAHDLLARAAARARAARSAASRRRSAWRRSRSWRRRSSTRPGGASCPGA